MRTHRVKYITLLPSLVTILNGVLGFVAIVLAGKGAQSSIGGVTCFELAAYMVLLAMVADMLDGRLARMSHNTSSFGGQLDSLCDLISFGVAPAFLMLMMLEAPQTTIGPETFALAYGSFYHRFIWLSAVAYVCCAAIRLARFNVENEENAASHTTFVGLPSPAAAGVIVSLIIFYEHETPHLTTIVHTLPFCALTAAVLMVSRLRYPHLLNQYLGGKKPFSHFIRVLLLLGLVLWRMQTALAIVFCCFAASGLVKWLHHKIVQKSVPAGRGEEAKGYPISAMSPIRPGATEIEPAFGGTSLGSGEVSHPSDLSRPEPGRETSDKRTIRSTETDQSGPQYGR